MKRYYSPKCLVQHFNDHDVLTNSVEFTIDGFLDKGWRDGYEDM